MSSLILGTATRYLLPLLLLLSVYLLFRGHNAPGGGFVGGLVASAAFALHIFSSGVEATRRILGVGPRTLIGWGLAVALLSGCLPLLSGKPFMTGLWMDLSLPGVGKLGTPLIFDVGVYMVVLGMSLLILFTLAEE